MLNQYQVPCRVKMDPFQATVVVKGTSNGTTTDFEETYIEAGADDVLVVSFVGFATQEVAVGGQDQIIVF